MCTEGDVKHLIVPTEFSVCRRETFQIIAAKTNIVSDPSHLVVKIQGSVSRA